jgi:thiamine-phosphate diphosphorylase
LPRLHIVTNDDVLQLPSFLPSAIDLLLNLQRTIALHIRSRELSSAATFKIVGDLLEKAEFVGALLVVNDRVDVALAARARGVQLGVRSLPVATVRAMAGPRLAIGYSAHDAEEAAEAERGGADFLLAGTIYPTASHPETQRGGLGVLEPGGLGVLAACVDACSKPVLAIGGVNAQRVADVLSTGAYGVAVISAVWNAADPVHAAQELVRLLES